MGGGILYTDAFLAAQYRWSFANVYNNGEVSTDILLGEVEKGLQQRVVEAYGQRVPIDHGMFLKSEPVWGNSGRTHCAQQKLLFCWV